MRGFNFDKAEVLGAHGTVPFSSMEVNRILVLDREIERQEEGLRFSASSAEEISFERTIEQLQSERAQLEFALDETGKEDLERLRNYEGGE